MAHRTLTRLASLLLPLALLPGAAPPDEHARAALLLDRATFGPRPGDLDAVLAAGVDGWLDRQLHPERIDDAAMDKALAAFPELALSTGELYEKYPRPSRDERKERKERKEARDERQQATENGEMDEADMPPPGREGAAGARAGARGTQGKEGPRQVYVELAQAKLLRSVGSERQLEEVLVDFWFNHFNVYARKDIPTLLSLPSYEREAIRPHVLGKFEDLLVAVAQHPAMLRYLDNWSSTKEGFDPREEIRRRMMADVGGGGGGGGGRMGQRRGGFGRGGALGRPGQEKQSKRSFGLNENYARELMELHTLGVDGGYTQADVREVARCFTGWTVTSPEMMMERLRERRAGGGMDDAAKTGPPIDGKFHFLQAAHDQGDKTVLGSRVASGGMDEGMAVLHMLANHPATMHFVCRKLAQRFVADDPSEELVSEMAAAWKASGGDIRTVLSAMFHSSRFVTEGSRRDKVKTPLELVASSLRATGARITWGPALVRAMQTLGMPLYMCQPPTGYDEQNETWLSAGNMLNRIKFVAQLAAGQLPGVALPEPPDDADRWAAQVLPAVSERKMSEENRATLREAMSEFTTLQAAGTRQEMALVLASPAFQKQ